MVYTAKRSARGGVILGKPLIYIVRTTGRDSR